MLLKYNGRLWSGPFFQKVFVIHKMNILQLLRKTPVEYQAVCNGKEGVDWISASDETCHFLPVPSPPL